MANNFMAMDLACLSIVVGLLTPISLTADQRRSVRAEPVKTCSAISLVRPGFGVAYRGLIQNDDYGLSMEVPAGLTGWGAAPVAPFHGFTVFLPEEDGSTSCSDFEIHLRVDLGDSRNHNENHRSVKVVNVGNIKGEQLERVGVTGGILFKNILVTFSMRRKGEVQDGSLWLVTPVKYLQKNLSTFEEIISKLTFADR